MNISANIFLYFTAALMIISATSFVLARNSSENSWFIFFTGAGHSSFWLSVITAGLGIIAWFSTNSVNPISTETIVNANRYYVMAVLTVLTFVTFYGIRGIKHKNWKLKYQRGGFIYRSEAVLLVMAVFILGGTSFFKEKLISPSMEIGERCIGENICELPIASR